MRTCRLSCYNRSCAKIIPYKYNDLFIKKGAAVQFESDLVQFISVGEGIARAIECLEATATNPADVYLYWLAVLASIKNALSDSVVPDDVRGQIRGGREMAGILCAWAQQPFCK